MSPFAGIIQIKLKPYNLRTNPEALSLTSKHPRRVWSEQRGSSRNEHRFMQYTYRCSVYFALKVP